MQQAIFEGLTVLYRAHNSQAGCSELCQDASGAKEIRIRIRNPAIQKEVLAQSKAHLSVRLSQGVLDLLLPWQEGQTLPAWLSATQPSLGQRRDCCLSLLAELIGFPVVPSLIALSAATENLCFVSQRCYLQLLPKLSVWRSGITPEQMIHSVAALIKEILTANLSAADQRRFPVEMQLFLLRCDLGAYSQWDSLQQDLAALPEELLPADWFLQKIRARIEQTATRYAPMTMRIVAACLAVAALLSLVGTYRIWENNQNSTWRGMPTVGDQVLHQEEEGAQ